MAQRYIADAGGLFTCEIEVNGIVLADAIEHDRAEEVLKCAVISALSVLAQDGPWVDALMESMAAFMTDMRESIIQEALC